MLFPTPAAKRHRGTSAAASCEQVPTAAVIHPGEATQAPQLPDAGWSPYGPLAAVGLLLTLAFVLRPLAHARKRRAGERGAASAHTFHHGWWIPLTRQVPAAQSHAVWAWPVHREYLLSRLG
jgi:hypothetical protein